MQMKNVSVSIVLDKRRIKANNKFPVKLRIFQSLPRNQKLYSTIYDFSEKEFASIWETTKPRNEYKEIRKELVSLELTANKTIDSLKRFTFESFESSFFNVSNSDFTNVFTIYDEVIKTKLETGAISTAEKYELSKRCIQSYLEYKAKKTDKLLIDTIDVQFLENVKFYCQSIKGLSPATIGIYLRNLRSIYRIAIKKGVASIENYPFNNDSFSIPTSKKVNKALTKDELKLLWNTAPNSDKQAIAKDFWFFSYYSYGMNTKDISELKHSSIEHDSFYYERAKTRNTKKERTIKQVPITNTLRQIIERRKNHNSEYLFGILDDAHNEKQKHNTIKLFNRTINKYFREFALSAGINEQLGVQLGTYHARHSFASIAVQSGTSHALISEILHDGNLKTTENYINSFPKKVFSELSESMDLGGL